jgi:predicted helicase
LADDWRDLLFPDLDDGTFSDAYAQTITFAMLLARVNGINFDSVPLHEIARQLGKKHSLIGKSFAVLTDSEATDELRVIETLRRVIGAVDWSRFDDGHTNVYVELYEQFLAAYDPKLRKKSGSYYTPEPVARFMVDFVNEILRSRLRRPWGFAADDVIVVDPAMGTGTFLVEIVRAVAETIDNKQGQGARPARLRELFQKRLVGFERQVAPYAVAELRLHQALKTRFDTDIPPTEVRFLTDALEDPRAQQGRLRAAHKIIQRSRAEANRIKREARVMVVIGNPPHVENARGHAPWIEDRRRAGPVSDFDDLERPSLDEFRAIGHGRYESDLHALHWYFWRWALWKVFDAHRDQPAGVVAFVTPSSYTTGKAFAGMRQYLRRTCDEGWIIDVSPEGNRSDINTRIFGDVQRQLCIGVFARYSAANKQNSANVHYVSVGGSRQEKFDTLRSIRLGDSRWQDCKKDWCDPFLPGRGAHWESYPQLSDLMPWTSRGVTTGRTWVYAPDRDTLGRRWHTFTRADIARRRVLFKEARDRKIHSVVSPLPGFRSNSRTLAEEKGDMLEPVRVGYRSFDRQWIIPDHRLMVVARPPLWAVRSEEQIYVTEQSSHPIDKGPGITFTSHIPDIHHYNARSGRVLPLYRDDDGKSPNFAPGLTRFLGDKLGVKVSSEDLLAYVAAVVAHSGYTIRFRSELQRPGVRVPLTASPILWREAVQLGRRVIWLHSYGERYVDESVNRPDGVTELVERTGPRVVRPIPDTPQDMPVDFEYDPESQELRVGTGRIGPVSPAVFEYEITGLKVVRKWLDYRLRQPRHKRNTSPLDDINCARWSRQFTDELLELLTILENCLRLEPKQSALLDKILNVATIAERDLEAAGVLPAPLVTTKPPRIEGLDRPNLFRAE